MEHNLLNTVNWFIVCIMGLMILIVLLIAILSIISIIKIGLKRIQKKLRVNIKLNIVTIICNISFCITAILVFITSLFTLLKFEHFYLFIFYHKL